MRLSHKAVALLLLCAVLLCALSSCTDRVEHIHCELGIYLPRKFKPTDSHGSFDISLSDGSAVIGINRYSFDAVVNDGILATHTPLKLAEIYRNKLEGATRVDEIELRGVIPYFTFTRMSEGIEYSYTPTFYATRYAYFIIVLVVPSSLEVAYRVEFLEYTDSAFILPEYA